MYFIKYTWYYNYNKLIEQKYSCPFEFVIYHDENNIEMLRLQGVYIKNISGKNNPKLHTGLVQDELDFWAEINPELYNYITHKDSVYQILDYYIDEEIDGSMLTDFILKYKEMIEFYDENPAIMLNLTTDKMNFEASKKLKISLERLGFLHNAGVYYM